MLQYYPTINICVVQPCRQSPRVATEIESFSNWFPLTETRFNALPARICLDNIDPVVNIKTKFRFSGLMSLVHVFFPEGYHSGQPLTPTANLHPVCPSLRSASTATSHWGCSGCFRQQAVPCRSWIQLGTFWVNFYKFVLKFFHTEIFQINSISTLKMELNVEILCLKSNGNLFNHINS